MVGHKVDARFTEHTVEVFAKGRRVASHRRSRARRRHSPEDAHMPERHRADLAWSPQRPHRASRAQVSLPGHPVAGPDREGPEAVDDSVETRSERVRQHVR
jgi:hypothetical protein